MAKYSNNTLGAMARLHAALADESRLRLLAALRGGELCVCQLAALVDLATSTVSKHLSVLREAGVIDARKEGRWVYYRPVARKDFPVFGKRSTAIFQSMETAEAVCADDRKLARIRGGDAGAMCGPAGRRKGVRAA